MKSDDSIGAPYGALDRLLHRIAFSSLDTQRMLGDIENRMFAGESVPVRRPVFVTSLPRAGTTILLEVLAALPEFASATYRHMPFVLAPVLWQRLSRGFRQAGGASERAHGDGIAFSLDSPEAFEEVLWKAFWPEHYRGGSIRPWACGADKAGFAPFFERHMAKIVAGTEGATRYLSKNNANIARLALIERLFPDASIVVPFRHPFAHVGSLMRQHERFSELHARDPFARRYMADLGHFEFGATLKPIAFAGRAPDAARASSPDFWLEYWCDAYEAVLASGASLLLVDHDELSARPGQLLPVLAERLDVTRPELLAGEAQRLQPRPPADPPAAPGPLITRAERVHNEMKARALRDIPVLEEN
ncbi:sulfotransferase [Acuticoccus sediminis]|uniref:sulfotransferase n=1 Tax=Acuticoccus sediminis TaxID=2184697 RepID=UPI001CFE23E9|nr:sulfotransferase [Acuticoccus sediminis]